MLITQNVKLKLRSSTIEHYKKLGYDISNKEIDVKVVDLSKGCASKIECTCDICGIYKNITYKEYFSSFNTGGYYTCAKCSQIKYKDTCLKKYGVDNSFKSDEIKKKIAQTNNEKYGCDNPFQNELIKDKIKINLLKKYGITNISKLSEIKEQKKKTCFENYNYTSPIQNSEIKKKIAQTNNEKYGCDNPFQNELIKDKIKETCFLKYGVENPSQNLQIHNKKQKTAFKRGTKNTLSYQGSYELDFIKKYNLMNITKANSIKYTYNNNEHIYFPDFFLDSLNLVIEIKSKYIYNLDLEKNIAKQKACIEQGFNHIFIIDKNYNEFEKLILNINI